MLFIVAVIVLAILETRIGFVVTAAPILVFSYLYFAKPKFILRSEYWNKILKEERYFQRFIISLIFLAVALYINYLLGTYVESTNGPALPDTILDHLEPVNFGPMPIYLHRAAVTLLLMYMLFARPTKLTFGLKAICLLIIVRSFTMVLTNLGLPAGRIPDEVGLAHVESINFTKDLFFSGHVAFSFLGYLLLRSEGIIKYFMLISSLILSFIVLAMHLHYSIDVVAAFFFTYGVYKITAYLFKKDYELYLTSPSPT